MNQISPLALPSEPAAEQSVCVVKAPLNFILPQDDKPVYHSAALAGGSGRFFFATEAKTVPIRDMRPVAYALSMDHEGFVLRDHQSAVADFYDDEEIARVYHGEIEALLKRELGASRVVIFDTTRRSDSHKGAANPDGARGPATRIHVDYTEKSGPQRVKDFLGEAEAARLEAAGARVVQVNVWRPIRGPVERAPLALADAATVAPDELVATDQVFPNRVGEIYHLAYSPLQRWYYAPQMTPGEVLLIKGWDSLADGRARFTPHTAFDPPQGNPSAPPRESIEIRTLVVIE